MPRWGAGIACGAVGLPWLANVGPHAHARPRPVPLGTGSRTQARAWVEAAAVRVQRTLGAHPDAWIDPLSDHVTLDGREVRAVAACLPRACTSPSAT